MGDLYGKKRVYSLDGVGALGLVVCAPDRYYGIFFHARSEERRVGKEC